MVDEAVPWMIGGGVRHSVEVARLLAYAAFGGDEGVIGGADLYVRPYSAGAGAGVEVTPGACAILNRAPGAAYDAYACRFPSQTTVAVSPTTATERTDLVIARVENPYESDSQWSDPPQTDVDAGTAVFRRIAVIEGVPAGSTSLAGTTAAGQSAIVLARITRPANTSTVQAANITDLRRINQARRALQFNVVSPGATKTLTEASYTNFGSATMSVEVPPWATHVTARAIMAGVRFGAAGGNGGAGWQAGGQLRLDFGALGASGGTPYDVTNESGRDQTVVLAGMGRTPVPRAQRGTTQTLRVQGLKGYGSTSLEVNTNTTVTYEVEFSQQPEAP